MAKYRKKPVVIEAIRFMGDNQEIVKLFGTAGIDYAGREDKLSIRTLEGVMTATKGDWIIKGIKGEFYPCKPDIFEATYEAV